MPDDFSLPPPELLRVDVVDLGPVIDPPFTDTKSFHAYLPKVPTKPVEFEPTESNLTDDGTRRAVEVALASDEVGRQSAGKRCDVLGVGTAATGRNSEYPLVTVYNYTDGLTVEVMVDLDTARVLEVRTENRQPPLADAERSQALDLLRDAGGLADSGVDLDTGMGLIVEEADFRDPRYGHRLVDLRFGPRDKRLPTAYAVVDLTDRDVVTAGRVPQEASS
ncbi:hypothetical protein [Streptomyces sp. NRRL B-24484]|uniref:hypothetical protein n=1 Tax=Streptomyces sp. NRRL B-24484 TaxID=1463833 RepID=UPI0004C256DA|nr:hypothetical protein [Streptomyces sp. NRRL B-24484]